MSRRQGCYRQFIGGRQDRARGRGQFEKLLRRLESCTISQPISGDQIFFRYDTGTRQRRGKSVFLEFGIQRISMATDKPDTTMPQCQQMARQIDSRRKDIYLDRDGRTKAGRSQYDGQTIRPIDGLTYILIDAQRRKQNNTVAIVQQLTRQHGFIIIRYKSRRYLHAPQACTGNASMQYRAQIAVTVSVIQNCDRNGIALASEAPRIGIRHEAEFGDRRKDFIAGRRTNLPAIEDARYRHHGHAGQRPDIRYLRTRPATAATPFICEIEYHISKTSFNCHESQHPSSMAKTKTAQPHGCQAFLWISSLSAASSRARAVSAAPVTQGTDKCQRHADPKLRMSPAVQVRSGTIAPFPRHVRSTRSGIAGICRL